MQTSRRGLRVRMGISMGINPADCQVNKAAGRIHYTGQSHMLAKAVCEAACGGMVLLSESTHARLPVHSMQEKIMVRVMRWVLLARA